MKRILFTIALVIAALSAFAQQQEVEPKPSHANFVTNKFWDNWEIGAGVGVQTWFFGDNQDEGYQVDYSRIWCSFAGSGFADEVDCAVSERRR